MRLFSITKTWVTAPLLAGIIAVIATTTANAIPINHPIFSGQLQTDHYSRQQLLEKLGELTLHTTNKGEENKVDTTARLLLVDAINEKRSAQQASSSLSTHTQHTLPATLSFASSFTISLTLSSPLPHTPQDNKSTVGTIATWCSDEAKMARDVGYEELAGKFEMLAGEARKLATQNPTRQDIDQLHQQLRGVLR